MESWQHLTALSAVWMASWHVGSGITATSTCAGCQEESGRMAAAGGSSQRRPRRASRMQSVPGAAWPEPSCGRQDGRHRGAGDGGVLPLCRRRGAQTSAWSRGHTCTRHQRSGWKARA
ncbi:hypothetical protein V5799_002930 [Amblyomma americanum]|uniref:Secreted protein n=1 Tax=Amblyomma americanum TaxID=6943 RepID=A0AAQ4DAE0_AMBAM